MGRTGVSLENLVQFVERVKALNNIEVEGIYSHFANTTKPDVFRSSLLTGLIFFFKPILSK